MCGTIYQFLFIKFSHFLSLLASELLRRGSNLRGYFEFSLAMRVSLSTNSLFAAV